MEPQVQIFYSGEDFFLKDISGGEVPSLLYFHYVSKRLLCFRDISYWQAIPRLSEAFYVRRGTQDDFSQFDSAVAPWDTNRFVVLSYAGRDYIFSCKEVLLRDDGKEEFSTIGTAQFDALGWKVLWRQGQIHQSILS